MKSKFQNTCDNLHFTTVQQFQEWRKLQTFRPYSLDKYESECACISLYIDALIQMPQSILQWPLRIQRPSSPSPDFLLTFGNDKMVGVEHSTITSTLYQQFRAQSLKNPISGVVYLDQFKIGGPPIGEYNRGWVGDEHIREWVTLAFQKVQEKFVKLNQDHFLKTQRNELLLNTVSYLPDLDMPASIQNLGHHISNEVSTGKYEYCFDAVSFIYGKMTYPHALIKGVS